MKTPICRTWVINVLEDEEREARCLFYKFGYNVAKKKFFSQIILERSEDDGDVVVIPGEFFNGYVLEILAFLRKACRDFAACRRDDLPPDEMPDLDLPDEIWEVRQVIMERWRYLMARDAVGTFLLDETGVRPCDFLMPLMPAGKQKQIKHMIASGLIKETQAVSMLGYKCSASKDKEDGKRNSDE